MKVYVAGRTADVDNVRKAQQICRDKGHEITFDWTDPAVGEIRPDVDPDDLKVVTRMTPSDNPFGGRWIVKITHVFLQTTAVAEDHIKTRAYQAALKDLRVQLGGWADDPQTACRLALREHAAVCDADCVIALYRDGRGLGKIIEVGMALGHGKSVILVGNFTESVFWYMPTVERITDLGQLDEIL